jgi:plasmid maintenance system antidote protein VapI
MHLQGVLAQHCARNPHYSLRAFAQRLEMNHSTLSQLLRGKRHFSTRTIRVLGKRLGLAEAAIEAFVAHEGRFPDNHSMREIEVQHRILELATLANFKTDVGWIARVLGVPADEVNVALAQLLATGLMRMEDKNIWIVKEQEYGQSGRSMANPRKGTRKG